MRLIFLSTVPETGKIKSYYILMRETTSPVWQKKFFADKTKMELIYSKDNYFFAVQSISEGGKGLPVVPGR